MYFNETDISINILFPPESQVIPFRHNVTSTPSRKTSAVEGDIVSGVAQVNKVKNHTTKALVTNQCPQ